MTKFGHALMLGAAALVFNTTSLAAPVGYTNWADFDAALPGPANTLDFDYESEGTSIAEGGVLGGITFEYDLDGVLLEITDGAIYNIFDPGVPFETTSSSNFLGTDDGGVLQDGDDLMLSFGTPVNAVGMYFITADPIYDDEISLTAGGLTAGLFSANDPDDAIDLGDGEIAYFLGIIDTMTAFDVAMITTSGSPTGIGDGWFFFNIDDITTAVADDVSVIPLPGAAWLFLSALAGLGWLRRKAAWKTITI